MGRRVALTAVLVWALVLAAEGRSVAKQAGDAGSGTLYFYDQRQNGTYNIQIHLKDVEVLALLGAGGEDYDDSYDEYSYEYHDPVETPYKPTSEVPEAAAPAAPNTTTTAEPCDPPSSAPTTTTTITSTTEAAVKAATTVRSAAASGRRRCRPGYTRREGGGCKRTAPGGRPLLALPFGLRLAQRHPGHVKDRSSIKPPTLD